MRFDPSALGPRRWAPIGICALCVGLLECNAIWGIDDLTFEASVAGASAGGGFGGEGGTPSRCPDGHCDAASEDKCTCPADCGSPVDDGVCNCGETCGPAAGDCSPCCGDGSCDSEDCVSCAQDCGQCDGATCVESSECQSGYCVEGICCAEPSCGAHATCATGACECEGAWLDCANGWIDGCEADGDTSPEHCGGCGNVCNGLRWECCAGQCRDLCNSPSCELCYGCPKGSGQCYGDECGTPCP